VSDQLHVPATLDPEEVPPKPFEKEVVCTEGQYNAVYKRKFVNLSGNQGAISKHSR
jgi:hypothetical protein